MADDDDVRGAPGPEELLSPTGPRRSSFTPAPNDAESLQAAANLFDDDAIAAALSAELARVASGPIPIQRPAVSVPEPAPTAEVEQEAPVALASTETTPVVPAPVVEETVTQEPVTQEPVTQEPVTQEPAEPEPFEQVAETGVSASPEPTVAVTPPAVAPQGPPDWATPLFGQPTVSDQSEAVQSPTTSDPFAPSSPSFAPSSGPFPPPGDSPPPTTDPDALRALYSAAPAPTVPAADAPPPPGYAPPDADAGSATLSAIEQLQAQLDQRDREAREYASWESSMLEVGTPESLAAVNDARAERAGVTSVDAASAPTAPPVEDPAAFLPPPVEEPAAFLPPPVEEPAVFLPPPVEEPAVFLPPPVEEPAAFLPPPASEVPAPSFAPPADDHAAPLAPPAEDEHSTPPPAADNPFDIFAASIEHQADTAPPTSEVTPFPGFAPPTDASTVEFVAPANPNELRFDPYAVADAPVFLEPTPTPSAPSAPSSPPSWNLDLPDSVPSAGVPSPVDPAAPAPDADEQAPVEAGPIDAPPALVEPPAPDGVAELWRTASESEPSAPPPPAETPIALEPPAQDAAPVQAAVPATPSPADAAPVPQPTDVLAAPPPSAPVAGGFEDLLAGSAAADPGPPDAAWSAPDPSPVTEPAPDAEPGDRRPFGEGVERDDAVDPSDSIFGAAHEPVSVNTAGVAVAPAYIVVESRPISVIRPDEQVAAAQLVRPPVTPAEPAGLEPTPDEQRVGRAARLFWLWFAANSSIAAIIFGTILFALGVSLRQAVLATLAGVALSFVPLGLGTLAGKRSGQPTMVISRATFGVVGNILPSLIALFSRLFWAAGLLWVLGAGTADILSGARLTDGFTTGQLTIIAMSIGFVLAIVIAYFGYALMSIVQLVISVISGIAIVGFIGLTFQYVNFTTALSTPDGPWILVVTGAVLVFSFVGLAWANSSSDVARYQRPESSGAASMLWATFGVALPSFVLISYGALLAASNVTLAANIEANPLDSLGRLLPVWYPGPLLAATALSLLSGVVLAIYSGGFALQAAGLRLRRSFSTLIAGVLMLLIAIIMSNALTDFTQLFRDFATTVAVPVAAWAGIFGAEMMIRKRRFDSHSLLNRGGVYADVRWGNLIALVAISGIGYGFLSATMPGLTWEGYLFSALGVPLHSQLATTDLGVLVALVLGLLFPLIAGRSAINAQEKAIRVPE
jgi:purine-cytosine permease-like protein